MVRSRLRHHARVDAGVLGGLWFKMFAVPSNAHAASASGRVVDIRQPICFFTALAMIAMLAGCGSPRKPIVPLPPISVAFSTTSAPPSSVFTNSQTPFAAVVSNDAFNDGVTWAVTCGSTIAGACGSFAHVATGSEINDTYIAPATVPTGTTVTVTATSVSDPTKSVQATITIIAPLGVTFTSNTVVPPMLLTGKQVTLAAVVTNDPANAGVAWTLTCGTTGAGACGTLSAATTASGAATIYTSPLAVPNSAVTITAASVTDPTTFVQATITIEIISVIFNPALPPSIPPGGQGTFTAVVNSDPENAGVTWTITCGTSGGCGSLNPTATASGVSTNYDAPAVAPAGVAVTVTATSVTDPTKTAQATILITAPALPDGTYVFSLSGTDQVTANPYFVAGVFVVTGGSVTGGEQDFHNLKSPPTGQNDLVNPASSSVSTTIDGNLQIALSACNGTDCTTTDTGVGVNGVETFNGTKVTTSQYRLAQFDASASSSGTMDLQTSTAAPAGGFAFLFSGIDHNALPLAIGGVLNVDGPGTISGTGSVFDYNDASLPAYSSFGIVLTDQTLLPSTVSSPDSFGRVVFNLTPSNFQKISGLTFAGYIVDANHIRMVEINDSIGAFTGGTALSQGTSTGSFTSASIAGSSFVFGISGEDTNSLFNKGAFQVAGVLTTASGGTVSGTLNFNDLTAGGVQAPIPFTGTYTVDPTGRVTLSNLTDAGATFTFNDELYLVGDGHATMVGLDTIDVLSGLAFQQTGGGSFTAASFSGKYALEASGFDPNRESELDGVGPVTADGVGSFAGAADLNWVFGTSAGFPKSDATVSGTFTADPSGVFTGTITGLDVTTSSNQDAFTYYVIDTTKVLAIETDSHQLTLVYFHLQQ
jgi:hypothetical protein